MWVRRRASISRHETVHTVLGVRFDFSAPSRTLRAENGLSLLARLGRSTADPNWQAHTDFLIAESEFHYAMWNPASQYEIVDSRLSRHWVWAQETDGVVVLSHPIIAVEGVLDDLWWTDLYQSPSQSSQKTQLTTPSFRFPLRAGGTEPLRGSPREAGGTSRRGGK